MAACLSSGVAVLSACVLANGDALHLRARLPTLRCCRGVRVSLGGK